MALSSEPTRMKPLCSGRDRVTEGSDIGDSRLTRSLAEWSIWRYAHVLCFVSPNFRYRFSGKEGVSSMNISVDFF